ncbi:Uncharacterised protein [[Flavobacterium] thermophilum]|nr:Uncharacterised protein [[Flavobacterium] thermophilum]
MLLTKEVEVKVNSKHIQYYLNKGYQIPKIMNKKGKLVFDTSATIKVNTHDLPVNSHQKIKYQCDNCGNVIETTYQSYYKMKKDVCSECYRNNLVKKETKWCKENIINQIKISFKNRDSICSNDIYNLNRSLFNACIREFGSVENAIKESGKNFIKIRKTWENKNDIVNEIKRIYYLHNDLSDSFVSRNYSGLYNIARKHFITWKNAVEHCGFDYSKIIKCKPNGYYTEEKIKKFIIIQYKNNKNLNSNYIQKFYGSLYNAACNIFGSWKNAIESCGLDYKDVLKKIHCWDIDSMKSYIEKLGYSVIRPIITKNKKINSNIKFELKCQNNHVSIIKFSHFLQGVRCKKCREIEHNLRIEKIRKYMMEKINKFVNEAGFKVDTSNYINNKTPITFTCPNNHSFEMTWNDFRKGNRCKYCSDVHNSKGVQKIKTWLNHKNIGYKINHNLEGCVYKNKLYFDFVIRDNQLIIEYDGLQHFKAIDYWGGVEQLKINIERDIIKNQYCIKNNIPLIRIPDWEYNNIETILEHVLGYFKLIDKQDVDEQLVHKFFVNHPDWSHEKYISQAI